MSKVINIRDSLKVEHIFSSLVTITLTTGIHVHGFCEIFKRTYHGLEESCFWTLPIVLCFLIAKFRKLDLFLPSDKIMWGTYSAGSLGKS